MFWSGNYIAMRELNSLLKEENVTLSQVLEADDVLQECKADNMALIQFLTRPDILAELVTLITEEPPKNVEFSLQYRHSTIACEVLTSQLPTLSDRLSMDTVQMHRLCDFINKEPPLNPLLASYFSKTIETLLDRSPKQDWYLYHIVCLRVLDFLKARRDFLPNLLRHLHTSAVLDALKCFIRLNDLFNKLVMEWFEEHQFLESLIAIICGTYSPPRDHGEKAALDGVEKGDLDAVGKEVPVEEQPESASWSVAAERLQAVAAANAAALLCDVILNGCDKDYSQVPAGSARSRTALALVARATSPAGVGALLQGMFTSPASARRHALVHGARVLLAMRRADLHAEMESEQAGSCRGGVELAVAPHLPLLHTALLQPPEPYVHEPSAEEAPADGGGGVTGDVTQPTAADVTQLSAADVTQLSAADVTQLSAADVTQLSAADVTQLTASDVTQLTTTEVTQLPPAADVTQPMNADVTPATTQVSAPVTREVSAPVTVEVPAPVTREVHASDSTTTEAAETPGEPTVPAFGARRRVGAARLQVAALLAALCGSEVAEVASTMLTLGTPGVLIDMFFSHPDNNFLHAQLLAVVRNALSNRAYRTQYARHILEECDLFNRLMDVYEGNETKRGKAGSPRAGYMGHVVQLLRTLQPVMEERGDALDRWTNSSIIPLIHQLDTPLGGYYPPENTYGVEADGMAEVETRLYDLNYGTDFANEEDVSEMASSTNMNKFLELSNQRMCDTGADMWDDAPETESEGDNARAEETRRAERDDHEHGHGRGRGRGHGHEHEHEDAGAGTVAHAVRDVLAAPSPWESSYTESGTTNMAGEGWAQFSTDGFSDPFASDAFEANFGPEFTNDGDDTKERFYGTPFGDDSFGDGPVKNEYTPFWGYQEKNGEANSMSGVQQGMRSMRLDELDDLLDDELSSSMAELCSSLADNLRTAMSSMTPEVIANFNANMTPALEPLTDVSNVTDVTATDANVNVSDVSEASNSPSESNVSNAASSSDTASQGATNVSDKATVSEVSVVSETSSQDTPVAES